MKKLILIRVFSKGEVEIKNINTYLYFSSFFIKYIYLLYWFIFYAYIFHKSIIKGKGGIKT